MTCRAVAITIVLGTAVIAACSGGSDGDPNPGSSSGSSGASSASSTSSGGSSSSASGATSSSSSSGSTSGASSGGGAVPMVIAKMAFTGSACPKDTEVPNLGDYGPPATPVPSGGTSNGKAVIVWCEAWPGGQGINVNGYATIAGGGEFRIVGLAPTEGDGQMGISVTPEPSGGKLWTGNFCTLEYPPGGGAAPGRLWGKITCADTYNGSEPNGCALTAEIRFENCHQKPE